MKQVFLLRCEICNGEYGETSHLSVHATKDSALDTFKKSLDPNHLKGQDASNEWKPASDDPNKEVFRTGTWGYVVWTLQAMPFYGYVEMPDFQAPFVEQLNKDYELIEILDWHDGPRVYTVREKSSDRAFLCYMVERHTDPKAEGIQKDEFFRTPIMERWIHADCTGKENDIIHMTSGQIRKMIMDIGWVREHRIFNDRSSTSKAKQIAEISQDFIPADTEHDDIWSRHEGFLGFTMGLKKI